MNTCRKCGAPFKASRANYTVNCPDCRHAPKASRKVWPAYAPADPGTVCTIGPNAAGVRCGRPAVMRLLGTDYAECSTHYIMTNTEGETR